MRKLKFYTINNNYINYLNKFDSKVPYNKQEKRPYIGIIIEMNDITYFAPLFSPKETHSKYSDNPTYMRIGKQYGIIRFNNMIPVIKEELNYLDFNNIIDIKYKNLVIAQNNFIQKNTDKIIKKAEKLYKFVTVDKKDFFINLSCDFKLLEEKAKLYPKQ